MFCQHWLIKITHRPQQIGHNTAINEWCQNIPQLMEYITHTLKAVQQKKHKDTQTDGPKDGHHQIKISSLIRIFHPIASFLCIYGKYTSWHSMPYEHFVNNRHSLQFPIFFARPLFCRKVYNFLILSWLPGPCQSVWIWL